MTDALAEFLAGDRPDDVALFLADEAVGNPEALEPWGTPVEGGLVLVVAGERGREVVARAVDADPMAFAQEAGQRDGTVDRDLAGGVCPDADGSDDPAHAVRFVFAFAEAESADAGGLYAEGDVIHAYARCACGEAYADKWVADG